MLKWTMAATTGLGLLLALSACSQGGNQASNANIEELKTQVADLQKQVQINQDVNEIKNLTRAYGYYVDKQLWPEVIDTFSDDARVEIAGRGVYRNRDGVTDLFLNSMGGGEVGLPDGMLFNHMILQGVVNVAEDGQTAKGRWRAFVQIAGYQRFALWSEGTYENEYVKRDGKWQISDMHFFSTYYTPYDSGWHKMNMPNNPPSEKFPPVEPPSIDYDVFPGHFVPPFHYEHPVTGEGWTMEDSRKYSTEGMSPERRMPTAQEQAEGMEGEEKEDN